MKKFVLAIFAILVAFPVMVNAQTYYGPHYEQRDLAPFPTTPYFLENRTGAPLWVELCVKFPGGREELWFFNIEPEKDVLVHIPNGGVRVSVKYAEVSVPKGNKIKNERVSSQLYLRQEENVKMSGWWFFRK